MAPEEDAIECWGTWSVLVPCGIVFTGACRLEMLIIGGRLVYGVSELRIRNWLGLTLPLIMSADIVTPQRGNARISDRLMG